MNRILTQADLTKLTGYTRPADIARCLKRQGVRPDEPPIHPGETVQF